MEGGLQTLADTVREVPPNKAKEEEEEDPFDKRLWIGNMDTRMTEYAILKLVQKHSTVRKIDFVYHKSGPEKGRSKGYCFVSFHTWEDAEKTRKALDGRTVLGRLLLVKWARGHNQEEEEAAEVATVGATASLSSASSKPSAASSLLTAESAKLSALSAPKDPGAKIQAIEAKLRLMQDTQKDFGINEAIKPPPGVDLHGVIQKAHSYKPYKRGHSSRNKRR